MCVFFLVDKVLELPPQYQPVGGVLINQLLFQAVNVHPEDVPLRIGKEPLPMKLPPKTTDWRSLLLLAQPSMWMFFAGKRWFP